MKKLAKLALALLLTLGLASQTVPAFAADVPSNTAAPTLYGNMAMSRLITVNPGTWTAGGAITYTYAWYACTTAIATATSTVPSDCVALTATSGWTTFGGQSVYLGYGASNLTLMFSSAIPNSMLGKFLSVKETASTATDSAFMMTANSEPLAATSGRPVVTSTGASNITSTSATVAGTVVANNTAAQIRYYLSTGSATTVGVPATNYYSGDFLNTASAANANLGPLRAYGTVTTASSHSYTGLIPGTTYYYQITTDSYSDIATAAGRFTVANVVSFTTKTIVNYNSSPSSGGAAPTDSNQYIVGTDTITFADQGTLVRTNYSFVGWNFGGTTYKEGDTITAPLGAVSASPVWVLGSTVTYFANGATGAVPTDSSSPFSTASNTTIQTAGALTKTGYTFTGWNTKANGTGTAYAPGATLAVSGQVKLYAQWQAASSAPAPAVTPIISGFSTRVVPSNTATHISITGINMSSVSSVVIGSLTGALNPLSATVVSSNASQLVIQTPALSPGSYSLQITNAQGIMTFTNAFVVVENSKPQNSNNNTSNGGLVSKTAISGFVGGVANLTNAQKAKLRKISISGSVKSITCIGYTQGPTTLSVDNMLSLSRAKNACAELKQIFGDKVSYHNYGRSDSRVGSDIRRVEIELRK